ncbi:hypothetical protein TGDOM2_400160, partial [Toxoplasma gondii GAB2-2007-GAL-DOM2]
MRFRLRLFWFDVPHQLFDLSVPRPAAGGRATAARSQERGLRVSPSEGDRLARDVYAVDPGLCRGERGDRGDVKAVAGEAASALDREREWIVRQTLSENEEVDGGEEDGETNGWRLDEQQGEGEATEEAENKERRWRQTAIRAVLGACEPSLRSALVAFSHPSFNPVTGERRRLQDRCFREALKMAEQRFREVQETPFDGHGRAAGDMPTGRAGDAAEDAERRTERGTSRTELRRAGGAQGRLARRLRGDVSSDEEEREDERRPAAEDTDNMLSTRRDSGLQISAGVEAGQARERNRSVKRKKANERLGSRDPGDSVGWNRREEAERPPQGIVLRWTPDSAESLSSFLASQRKELQREFREGMQDVEKSFDACVRMHHATAASLLSLDPRAFLGDSALLDEIQKIADGLQEQKRHLREWTRAVRAVRSESPFVSSSPSTSSLPLQRFPSSLASSPSESSSVPLPQPVSPSASSSSSFSSSAPSLSVESASAAAQDLSRARLAAARLQRQRLRVQASRVRVETSAPELSARLSLVHVLLQQRRGRDANRGAAHGSFQTLRTEQEAQRTEQEAQRTEEEAQRTEEKAQRTEEE